ncbi:MAG: efflux RND transporter periplasmic adaptor subunit, partial [Gammaproteobacteria bacterium]|nr:efflux RND transporter periplasmic adaptor subunit [Gammaproteobacteria bacterium]
MTACFTALPIAVFCAALLAGCSDSSGNILSDEITETPVLQTAVRVIVEPVAEIPIQREGEVTGIVTAFRKATVAAEVGGRVIERLIEPGDFVAAEQVLVVLDSDRVRLSEEQAEAQHQARTVDLHQARQRFERGKNLFERNAISKDALDDLRFAVDRAQAELGAARAALNTARRAVRDSRVAAPFAGTAEMVHAQQGDYLNPGAPVATLADFSRARVRAGVTASEAASVQAGHPATLVFEALGGMSLSGEVQSVGRIADDLSGTYPVEIWLSGEAASRLREGMVAAVQLSLPTTDPKPAVPRAAL